MKYLKIRIALILLFALTAWIVKASEQSELEALMATTKSKTVMFISGAFVTNDGWKEWRKYFEERGYKTYAPAWPYKNGSATELRGRQPDRALAELTFKELVEHHAKFAASLPEKPILIGHSTGGLVAQLLLQRDLGVACIAYHSLSPKGVITLKWSFVKAATPSLGLFKSKKKTFMISFKQFQYAFVNGMALAEQKKAYEDNASPESYRVTRGALTKAAKVNFKKPHSPLLFMAGANDHIIPPALNKKNFKRYKDEGSVTEYREDAGRTHFAIGQPTWKDDADIMLEWIKNLDPPKRENSVVTKQR